MCVTLHASAHDFDFGDAKSEFLFYWPAEAAVSLRMASTVIQLKR